MERRRAAFILSFRSSSFFSSHQTTSCLWSWFFPSFSPVHWPRNDDFLCQKIRILFLFFLSRVPFSVARNEDHREKKGKPESFFVSSSIDRHQRENWHQSILCFTFLKALQLSTFSYSSNSKGVDSLTWYLQFAIEKHFSSCKQKNWFTFISAIFWALF